MVINLGRTIIEGEYDKGLEGVKKELHSRGFTSEDIEEMHFEELEKKFEELELTGPKRFERLERKLAKIEVIGDRKSRDNWKTVAVFLPSVGNLIIEDGLGTTIADMFERTMKSGFTQFYLTEGHQYILFRDPILDGNIKSVREGYIKIKSDWENNGYTAWTAPDLIGNLKGRRSPSISLYIGYLGRPKHCSERMVIGNLGGAPLKLEDDYSGEKIIL